MMYGLQAAIQIMQKNHQKHLSKQQKLHSLISYKNNFLLYLLTLLVWCSSPSHAVDQEKPLFNGRHYAVFEINNSTPSDIFIYDQTSKSLGIAGWNRIIALFPAEYRKEIIQFNVMGGRRWAGQFGGDGQNDLNKPGYRLSVAKYLLQREPALHDSKRQVTSRRATLDWTIIHELGHYICLIHNTIELFSQAFDGDNVPQPHRQKRPLDYPIDGSPKTYGNFVTSYAERTKGDEEVVETFTTYMTIKSLPTNDSLVAKKIRFFDQYKIYRTLRQHIQNIHHVP